MKKLSSSLAMFMFIAAVALTTSAQHRVTGNVGDMLSCFSGVSDEAGFNGTCTPAESSVNGISTVLNTVDGDTNPSNNYAGLYSAENKFLSGRPLAALNRLGFSFSGSAVGAGSPRFSVGIDVDGDSLTDFFVFIAAYSCSDGMGNVNAGRQTCRIYTSDGTGPFAGASGLAAAFPGAVVASDHTPFIIADEPGIWTLRNVSFGGAESAKK